MLTYQTFQCLTKGNIVWWLLCRNYCRHNFSWYNWRQISYNGKQRIKSCRMNEVKNFFFVRSEETEIKDIASLSVISIIFQSLPPAELTSWLHPSLWHRWHMSKRAKGHQHWPITLIQWSRERKTNIEVVTSAHFRYSLRWEVNYESDLDWDKGQMQTQYKKWKMAKEWHKTGLIWKKIHWIVWNNPQEKASHMAYDKMAIGTASA